jgi:hypothetical protein
VIRVTTRLAERCPDVNRGVMVNKHHVPLYQIRFNLFEGCSY